MPALGRRREVTFSPEFAGRLAELITAEDDVKIVQVLREALDAEISIRAPALPRSQRPEGAGKTNYLIIPDWRVRVLAAKIMAEMKHGRPKQQLDVNVNATLTAPMSRIEAARELLGNWEDVKRIGDEHVKLLKQALPALPSALPAQDANAQIVDVELPDGQ